MDLPMLALQCDGSSLGACSRCRCSCCCSSVMAHGVRPSAASGGNRPQGADVADVRREWASATKSTVEPLARSLILVVLF